MLSKSKIVCAAILFHARGQDIVVIGARHYDWRMHETMERVGVTSLDEVEQGFLDQHGEFFSRINAYYVAIAANQIEPKKGKKELFSEDLY